MAGATGFNTVWRLNASVYGIITPYKGLNIEGTFNYSPTLQPSRKTTTWAHCSDIPHRNITARALPFPVKALRTGR